MRQLARLSRPLWPALIGLSLGPLVFGCPRQPEAPDPGMGTPCEQLSDCNPGATCGLLALCVDGYCEDQPSLVRPCPGSGDPVPEP